MKTPRSAARETRVLSASVRKGKKIVAPANDTCEAPGIWASMTTWPYWTGRDGRLWGRGAWADLDVMYALGLPVATELEASVSADFEPTAYLDRPCCQGSTPGSRW